MIIVEKLAPYHDVNGFTCGSARRIREMNVFLRENARNPGEGKTYVVVPYAQASDICAYFTTAPDPLAVAALPEGEELNSVHFTLRYLAVAQAYQMQGIGTQILYYLIDNILTAAEIHPELESLQLWPLDETARDWYLSRDLGFETVFPGLLLLSLPVETMRRASTPPME